MNVSSSPVFLITGNDTDFTNISSQEVLEDGASKTSRSSSDYQCLPFESFCYLHSVFFSFSTAFGWSLFISSYTGLWF